MRTPSRLLALLASATLGVALGGGTAAADDRPVPGPGTSVAAGAPALPTGLTGVSFLVADLDTGDILAAKDAHHRLLPASTLKILTGLTLIPRVPKFSTVVPTFDDVNIEGSRVGIIEKHQYPAYQIFRAMLMVSGNDAANAAATAAGGQAETARLMNEEARRIGALDTHAVNPSGLDAAEQKTTAYDLALIGRAAMQLPDFRAYVATKRSTINGKDGHPLRVSSHDKLLWNYDGAIGIKNGYTVKAGATFVGAATRGGHTLIVTVMHAQARVWPEVAHLMDWGFAAEAAGAASLGRLPDPPGQPVVGDVRAAKVRAAAAHTREQPTGPLVPIEVGAGLGLVVFLVVRRRLRTTRNPLKLELPL
ncbi:MAG: peptidase D-alanyl-D-alanine carboxypeptidase 1 [Frankiales bacterium]|nr:peptidase D-alanyl-D-alanine carboxypeptidase 1 [Frankiales bacterium]